MGENLQTLYNFYSNSLLLTMHATFFLNQQKKMGNESDLDIPSEKIQMTKKKDMRRCSMPLGKRQ